MAVPVNSFSFSLLKLFLIVFIGGVVTVMGQGGGLDEIEVHQPRLASAESRDKVLYTFDVACLSRRVSVMNGLVRVAIGEALGDIGHVEVVTETENQNTLQSTTEHFISSGRRLEGRALQPGCTVQDKYLHNVSTGIISSTCSNGSAIATAMVANLQQEDCIKAQDRDVKATSFERFRQERKLTPQNPNDTLFNHQWNLRDWNAYSVQAEAAWQTTYGGGGGTGDQPRNTVAVIDTYFLQSHPDLVNKWYRNLGETDCNDGVDNDGNGLIDDCYGWNFDDGSNDLMANGNSRYPLNTHGTAVAGFVGAQTDNSQGLASICQGCRLLPISTGLWASAIVEGINYVASLNIRLVNFSWGWPETVSTIEAAILAVESSMSIVQSAGNEHCDLDVPGECGYHFPADMSPSLSNMIVVSAHDSAGDPASWTTYGSVSCHVFAGGVAVPSLYHDANLNPLYVWSNGTSFSSPTVAGILGLIRHLYPSLSPCQLKEIIIHSAQPHGPMNGLVRSNGFAVAPAALTLAASESASPQYCQGGSTTSTTTVPPPTTAPPPPNPSPKRQFLNALNSVQSALAPIAQSIDPTWIANLLPS